MGRHEDPRERRRAAQEDDPYEHLMDNIDTLLQDDEYEGPDSGRPPRRSAPDQWYDAYGDENDYNAGYDPGYGYPEQPRCPEFRAYNVDFEQPPRQKRRPRPQENHPEYYGGDAGAAHTSGQPRKKKARNDAPRSSAPRSAKRRRHPILKLLLGLLIVLSSPARRFGSLPSSRSPVTPWGRESPAAARSSWPGRTPTAPGRTR